MKNKNDKAGSGYVISAILFFLSALFVFKLWHDQGLEYPHSIYNDFSEVNSFEIDPYTILSDIGQSKKDIFKKPVINDYEKVNLRYATDSFSWTQSDYFSVANALQQFMWNESLDDWKIYSMKFYKGCQNKSTGFSSADITYFKYSFQVGGYKVREMEIYPSSNKINWARAEYWTRPLFGWKSLNLRFLNITADDALQIAEENGGQEFRIKYNNRCDISLLITPNSDSGNVWRVYYDFQGNSESFDIQINPLTGWR